MEVVQQIVTKEVHIDKDPRDEESDEEVSAHGGGAEEANADEAGTDEADADEADADEADADEADADVEDDESIDEEYGRVRRRRRSRSRSHSKVSSSPFYRSRFSLSLDFRTYAQHFTGVGRKSNTNDSDVIRFSFCSCTAACCAEG